MSTPITWRNVNGPSLGDPSVALARAQQSIGSVFDPFATALKQQETIDAANWENQKKNNTEAFMQTLFKANDPTSLAKLKESGALDQIIEANGAQIDKAAARTALDARMGVLQDRQTKEWAFNDAARTQVDAPVLAQARSLIYEGKFSDAQALRDKMSPQSQAIVMGDLDKQRREVELRGMHDDKSKKDLERIDAEMSHWKASEETAATQARASLMSAGAAASNAATNKMQLDFNIQNKLEKELAELQKDKNAVGSSVSTDAGNGIVLKGIDQFPKETQSKLLEMYGMLRADDQFKDVRPGVMLAALSKTIGSLGYFSNTTNAAKTALRDIIAADGTKGIESENALKQVYDTRINKLLGDLGRLTPGKAK